MRMRMRSNVTERLASCGDTVIITDDDDKNVLEVLKDKKLLDLRALFGNDDPVYLEIGCGLGKFACETALKDPCVNVLAVERISNVILTGAEFACEKGIKNVKFLRGKAECLQKYVPSSFISGIYLNFSTPLPKKGYTRQRLTSERFLEIYKDLLKNGGFIYQKTDDADFFDFSCEEMKKAGLEIIFTTRNLHENGITGIVTEYERKFIEEGLPIYAVKAIVRK